MSMDWKEWLCVVATAWVMSPVQAQEHYDPWEKVNRSIFTFNDTLDYYALKPVARGYDKVMPAPLQKGVGNFFNNIGEVRTIFNDLLQLKFKQAGLDSTRLLVNSTVGIFGLIDIGSRIGLDRHEEDFGQTLGYWGVGSGPYLVLPLLGPNTLRDTAGFVPDYMMSPYPDLVEHDLTRYSLTVLDVVDTRASFLEAENLIAGDRYAFFRNAFLQRRQFLVTDGKLDDTFLDDDALFDEDDDLFEDDTEF